jgi:hypothetical protein
MTEASLREQIAAYGELLTWASPTAAPATSASASTTAG